jgi:hypothetical protein
VPFDVALFRDCRAHIDPTFAVALPAGDSHIR